MDYWDWGERKNMMTGKNVKRFQKKKRLHLIDVLSALTMPFSFHVYIRRFYQVLASYERKENLRRDLKREEMHAQREKNVEPSAKRPKNPANSCCETGP